MSIIKSNQGKSLIINCAGIGSRLGLGCTKALLDIDGRSLISIQLEQFKSIEDIRIVVGYQSNEVIEEVLKYRRDVTFVYNREYFETKTGYSFYLGAIHANDYVIELDGDLLIHPDDIDLLLNLDREFVGYSDIHSTDSVLLEVNDSGMVVSFDQSKGNYEWTGPLGISKSRLREVRGSVYEMIEPQLPIEGLKVRAYDIDTYEDYINVKELIKDWNL